VGLTVGLPGVSGAFVGTAISGCAVPFVCGCAVTLIPISGSAVTLGTVWGTVGGMVGATVVGAMVGAVVVSTVGAAVPSVVGATVGNGVGGAMGHISRGGLPRSV